MREMNDFLGTLNNSDAVEDSNKSIQSADTDNAVPFYFLLKLDEKRRNEMLPTLKLVPLSYQITNSSEHSVASV